MEPAPLSTVRLPSLSLQDIDIVLKRAAGKFSEVCTDSCTVPVPLWHDFVRSLSPSHCLSAGRAVLPIHGGAALHCVYRVCLSADRQAAVAAFFFFWTSETSFARLGWCCTPLRLSTTRLLSYSFSPQDIRKQFGPSRMVLHSTASSESAPPSTTSLLS